MAAPNTGHDSNMSVEKRLVSKILETMDHTEYAKPIYFLDIDWDKVEIEGMEEAEMKTKWESMLENERIYRTSGEVLQSMLETSKKKLNPEVHDWNSKFLNMTTNNAGMHGRLVKAKKARGKNKIKYPPKAMNRYQVFTSEKLKDGRTFSEVSRMWKKISDDEKEVYNQKAKESQREYVKRLEQFIEDHPEDYQAKDLLNKAKKSFKITVDPKKTKGSDTEETEGKGSQISNSVESTEMDTTVLSSPSPKKKKKKKSKSVKMSGLEVFIDRKKEEYVIGHPGLNEEEIQHKLEKKYNKLSDKKRQQYEDLAEELSQT